jgi:hypothetical protein
MESIMSKELTTKAENTELANIDTSIFLGSASGFEGTDSTTFKTPFLKILQALSPELKKSDPKYISGAEQGMYCNSATQSLHRDINVVVLRVEHSLISWKPNRGGFVSRVNKSLEESVVTKKDGMKKWDAEGNDVMDTIEFFCLNIDEPSDIFILSLSAASFKHARSFATRLRMLKANGKAVNVAWAGVWNIATMEEKNDKGSWFTLGNTPEFVRFVTKEERDDLIMPAIDMLKTADTDYTVIESSLATDNAQEETF